MFEDLLIALENLEEQDHKKRGELTSVAAKLGNDFGTRNNRNFFMVLYFAQKVSIQSKSSLAFTYFDDCI